MGNIGVSKDFNIFIRNRTSAYQAYHNGNEKSEEGIRSARFANYSLRAFTTNNLCNEKP